MNLERDAFDLLQEEPTRLVRILAKTDPLAPEYAQVLNALYRIGLVHDFIGPQLRETAEPEKVEAPQKKETPEAQMNEPKVEMLDVRKALACLRKEKNISIPEFLKKHFNVDRLSSLPESSFSECMTRIEEERNAAH